MSSAVSFPFHDNCTAIPIYLYTYYLCMYFVFQCSLVVVTVEWYDNRIIGDFRFFLCAICLICQFKNPSHHCYVRKIQTLDGLDRCEGILFSTDFWNPFLEYFDFIMDTHQNMTSKIMVIIIFDGKFMHVCKPHKIAKLYKTFLWQNIIFCGRIIKGVL